MLVITNYIGRVEEEVRRSLRNAQVIALVEMEVSEKPNGYWERIYLVAWERMDQCGTHRVCIDSQGKSMCVMGHYDMTKADAIGDMLIRANLSVGRI